MARTRTELEGMTNYQLREIAKELGITGMSKAPKAVIVSAILGRQAPTTQPAPVAVKAAPKVSVATFNGLAQAVPDGSGGSRVQTRIRVSCGGNTNMFDVVGKPAGEVVGFLKEALNIPEDPMILVNKNVQQGGYILQPGDELEFLKPAGRKGC